MKQNKQLLLIILVATSYSMETELLLSNKQNDDVLQKAATQLPGQKKKKPVVKKLTAKPVNDVIDHFIHLRKPSASLYKCIETHLEYEVDQIDERTGWTLLHFAASQGERRACKILIQRGFNPTIRDKNDRAPFLIAQQYKHHYTYVFLAKEYDKRISALKAIENLQSSK